MTSLPTWAEDLLRVPGGAGAAHVAGDLVVDAKGRRIGRIDHGILRFPLPGRDDSISFYQAVGGAHFHERSKVAYAMTSLDTPVYHAYLAELRPVVGTDGVVLDIGGGDGRNARPWLAWGAGRVIVIDAVFEALARFRARVAEENPAWLDRLLLVEGDARALPFAQGCADCVTAIEVLHYLNEEYRQGIAECARVLSQQGRLLVSDRDYEGGLLMRLFYFGGVSGMLKHAGSRDLWDGTPEQLVRSRCFTEAELVAMVGSAGLDILERKGISIFSLVLAALRARSALSPGDEGLIDQVHALLRDLGASGAMRRCHVLVARH